MSDPSPVEIRARLLLAKGLIGDAVDALRAALSDDPRDAALRFLLGIAEEDRGDLAHAAEAFDTIASAWPHAGLRADLARTLDHTLAPAARLAAVRRAIQGAAADIDTAGPDWERYADHLRCLRAAPLDHYQRIFMALDPATGAPMGADAAWYFRADGQLSASDGAVLNGLMEQIARPGLRIVEVGSAAGLGSTRIFGAHIKRLGGELLCVDPWEPIYNADAYDVFRQNMRLLGLDGVVTPLRMTSREAAAEIDDGTCDLVFIDGDHRYDAVRADIALWRAKAKPGGILCGDDCEGRPADYDPAALQAHKNDDATHLRTAGGRMQEVHCGVVLAVAEAFGEDYRVLGTPPGLWVKAA